MVQIVAKGTIQIPFVPKQLSVNLTMKIIKNKNGRYTLGKTSGAHAIERMITTMVTGESNLHNAPWDPELPLHLTIVGWKPQKNCDLHNCLKPIADSLIRGLEKWGFTNDSTLHIHEIRPHYDPTSRHHGTIFIYFWQQVIEQIVEKETKIETIFQL